MNPVVKPRSLNSYLEWLYRKKEVQAAENRPEQCWKKLWKWEKQNVPNENAGCNGHCLASPSAGHSGEQPGCLQQESKACMVLMQTPSVLEANASTG